MKISQIVSKFLDSNTFIVEDNEKVFIFDCGVEPQRIKDLINGKKVIAIFLTHGHYDHSRYAVEYAKEFNCKIYANIFVKETMQDCKKNYGEGFSIKNFEDFIFIEGDGILRFEDIYIEYFSTKGHSKCSCCYLLDNNLFAGDVLFYQGIGRTDLYGGNKKEMLESLKKIEKIDFENLYSGHDKNSNRKQQEKNIQVFERFLSR